MKRSSPLKFLIVVILICSWFIPVFATSAKAAPSSPSGFANGFNEQFTNSASNWYIAQGTWSYGSGKIHGNGLDNDYSEVYFNRANYKNFDYQVKMKRIGCASCANYIYFRSTSTTSVVFRYTNSGYFRVDSYDGSYGTWQDWKASSAIIKGGYIAHKFMSFVFLSRQKIFFCKYYTNFRFVILSP